MFLSRHVSLLVLAGLMTLMTFSARADILQVPQQHATIQAALNAARPGDTVLIAAGTYNERIRVAPGVTLKSAGDDTKGNLGLARAEATILDGGGKKGTGPGVQMAEGATLDGFTVRNVGLYDDAEWNKHYATLGEEQSHEHIGVFGTPGVGVAGVNCTIIHNIVHHNGFTGIAIRGVKGRSCSPRVTDNFCYRNMGGGIGSMEGSTALIQRNVCFENFFAGIGHDGASPLVLDNVCYGNVRAGIGISEGACPVVRGNHCYQNRRAGIGIRTGADTSPLVEGNDCHDNEMAGIGAREDATPIIRGNRCYRNKMAGIGSRDGARGLIENNECFENEMAGIGSRLGAAPVIRGNRCYKNAMAGIGAREKASPVIEGNECFENQMAGIGCREEAAPIIRGNRCYKNQMAGIGARLGARPIIADNECFENQLAGIGSREGAVATIVGNRCYKNAAAGIGSTEGARPLIVNNECRENALAGIGVSSAETTAIVVGNRCVENRLVALGLPDGATAYIHGNDFSRTGGVPPLIAVKGGSAAVLSANRIQGGGVAGVLVEGTAHLAGNRFVGAGAGQGSAVWVWDKSTAHVAGNEFQGYRNAVNASGSAVTITDNVVAQFQSPAIIVRKPSAPPHVAVNIAVSANPQDQPAAVDGADVAGQNQLKTPEEAAALPVPDKKLWPQLADGGLPAWKRPPVLQEATITEGDWKLVIPAGEAPTYKLYNLKDDPDQKKDLAGHLEQIVFRLRGRLERNEGANFTPGPVKQNVQAAPQKK